ncbi:MAG: metallophosphoesterase family protein [Anaerolineales bacterium]
MRLLLFSDLHRDYGAAAELVKRAPTADIVVGAGDYSTVHRGLDEIISILQQIEAPTILVPGNNETADELRQACSQWESAHVLHGNGITVDGTAFFGLGGGVPVTPFGPWSYDFTEQEALALLSDCPARCVLVSHSPPKGVVDVSSDGKNLGSTTVRDTVIARNPWLVVCGHIHPSAGQQAMLGETTVVNAGPHGVEWEL